MMLHQIWLNPYRLDVHTPLCLFITTIPISYFEQKYGEMRLLIQLSFSDLLLTFFDGSINLQYFSLVSPYISQQVG